MKITDKKIGEVSKLINVHAGHRGRLRNNLVENEWENVDEYKMLEYILGLSIPRKDTNEIAHNLISEFGSLAGVLDASVEDLKQVKGIGEVSATFLHGIPNIFKAYKKSKLKGKPDLSTPRKTVDYIGEIFNHMPYEEIYLISVDAQSKLISLKRIARGTNNEVSFELKTVNEIAIRSQAQGIIIMHNHPDGEALPSSGDVEMTRQIYYNLALSGIPLLDHIIITKFEENYYSFKEHNYLNIFKDELENMIKRKITFNNNPPKYE